MLRAYDRPGGIGIYSRNIVKYLLKQDNKNNYLLIYNNKKHLGTYSNLSNVKEIYIHKTNPALWDQILVPFVLRKWKIDLVFNTKFTIPFLTNAGKVMSLHGASWFVHPEIYKKFDVFYVKRTMKLYSRKADYLISNSNLTTEDYIKILNAEREKIQTIYFATENKFHEIKDPGILNNIRNKYSLPERFILSVISYDPVKNFGSILDSFEQCRKKENIHLVVVGKNCYKYYRDFNLSNREISKYIHFKGWVDHSELPVFYNLAEVCLFPSIYETFGLPIIEAMSCKCPVITSNTGAIPELSGNSAILVNPHNTKEIAEKLLNLLQNPSLADFYKEKGLERAKFFSWESAAEKTLKVFNRVYAQKLEESKSTIELIPYKVKF